MKLLFYSGGQSSKNRVLHQALSRLAGKGRNKSLTYIPFCADQSGNFFRRAIRRYKPHGFTRFQCLPVDRPFSSTDLKRALQSDVIYLAGGNTYYFLHHLRQSGILPKLRRYAKNGGVLAGLSAGGLILSPTINLAGYPPGDADVNRVRLRDLRGLDLVKFEFFPHYENRVPLKRSLAKYSLRSRYPILAVPDGGGIIVDGDTTLLWGKVMLWRKGESFQLGS